MFSGGEGLTDTWTDGQTDGWIGRWIDVETRKRHVPSCITTCNPIPSFPVLFYSVLFCSILS